MYKKNISGVHRPLVLLGCGLLHKCLGRCLPTSLSPGKIGCSSAQSWRSHHADRRALIHTHLVCAHTHTTHTVLDLMQTGKCAARTEWTGSPSASELSSNQSKALSLMASQVGGWMGRWVGVVRGGNCAALAKVMYCLLWMEVQTRRSVMDVWQVHDASASLTLPPLAQQQVLQPIHKMHQHRSTLAFVCSVRLRAWQRVTFCCHIWEKGEKVVSYACTGRQAVCCCGL